MKPQIKQQAPIFARRKRGPRGGVRAWLVAALAGSVWLLGTPVPAGADFGARIAAADEEPQNWLSTQRNHQETRHPAPIVLDSALREPPEQFATAAQVKAGQKVYEEVLWNEVLIDGNRTSRGMVGFKQDFTPAQLDSVRAYLIDRAQAEWQSRSTGPGNR